jgi:ribosomal protein L40E
MDMLLRLVGILSILLVAWSVFVLVRHLGAEARVRGRGLVVTLLVSIAILLLFAWVLDAGTSAGEWALGAAGVAAGVGVALLTPMRRVGGEVYARRTGWAFAAWVVGFAFAQLAVLGVVPGGQEGGLAAMFLATGLSVGTALTMGIRRTRLATAPGEGMAGTATGGFCAHCGTANPGSVRFCNRCGWRVLLRTRAKEVVS